MTPRSPIPPRTSLTLPIDQSTPISPSSVGEEFRPSSVGEEFEKVLVLNKVREWLNTLHGESAVQKFREQMLSRREEKWRCGNSEMKKAEERNAEGALLYIPMECVWCVKSTARFECNICGHMCQVFSSIYLIFFFCIVICILYNFITNT